MFRDTNVVLTECYERYKSTRDDLERLKELLRSLTTKVERSKTTEVYFYYPFIILNRKREK